MGPIDSHMDVVEQTNALSLGDTLAKNPISPSLVEGAVYHLIAHGFMAGSFYICIIDQSNLVCEVRPYWIHPVVPVSNQSDSTSRITQHRLPKEFTEYCLVA